MYAQYYGGKEVLNKSFRIEKSVRVEDEHDDDDWFDKVTDVSKEDVVIFKIRIENVGEVTVDDMKYEDFLPDEMERVGGDGLTEYWDDFEPDDKRTFEIKAKVDPDEFDRDEDFEMCVVNKVELTYDDDFEGSDTATVCFTNDEDKEIKELPKTGASSLPLALSGFGLITTGGIIRKLGKKNR